MERNMGRVELGRTLQTAGKTISLAAIVIGLVLLTLLNTGTALESVRTPVRAFAVVGILTALFGFYEVVATHE